MNIYDSLFTQDAIFNEQVAREIFDSMTCAGLVLGFFDGRGNCWSNDEEALAGIGIDERVLSRLAARVDDGGEPVMTQWNGWGLIVGEVRAQRKRCGHVFIALENSSPESTMGKLDMAEVIFAQFSTIARLMEEQALLSELHMKASSVN